MLGVKGLIKLYFHVMALWFKELLYQYGTTELN